MKAFESLGEEEDGESFEPVETLEIESLEVLLENIKQKYGSNENF
jgi:hypothetical protein